MDQGKEGAWVTSTRNERTRGHRTRGQPRGQESHQLHAPRGDHLDNMDQFLERHKLPELAPADAQHWNPSVPMKGTEFTAENLPTKLLAPTESLRNDINPLRKTDDRFQETEEEPVLPKPFYEASMTLMPKPNKDAQENKTTDPYLS